MARRGDNIHKRKDGRWEGRYKDGYRADGSVKYSSVYSHSYFECKKKLADAQSSPKSISKVQTEKLFSDLLIQWLFANQIRLKGATEAKYTNIIESHIIPAIGGVKLSALNSSTINTFLDRQLNQGGKKHGEALAPSYVRTMAVIIEAAINYGVMEGLCTPLRTPINILFNFNLLRHLPIISKGAIIAPPKRKNSVPKSPPWTNDESAIITNIPTTIQRIIFNNFFILKLHPVL